MGIIFARHYNKPKIAIKFFDKALKLDLRLYQAMQAEASALIGLGMKKEGINLLQKVLEVNPNLKNVSEFLRNIKSKLSPNDK